MAESGVKTRSIRLDEGNWEWVSGLPGSDRNDAILRLRERVEKIRPEYELADVITRLDGLRSSVYGASDKLDEMPEMVGEVLRAVVAELKGQKVASAPQGGGFDPATIPGVKAGLPAKAGFPCVCRHTGCQGAKFVGATRFQAMCDACQNGGHSGEPRECAECYNDRGPG